MPAKYGAGPQMRAMHARATAAGMDPYGSSADQMHIVPHTRPGDPPVDNSWQELWRSKGPPSFDITLYSASQAPDLSAWGLSEGEDEGEA